MSRRNSAEKYMDQNTNRSSLSLVYLSNTCSDIMRY